MAGGLILAALRLLLDGLGFGIHCKSDELHVSGCNGKRTNSAAHRLVEVCPFRLGSGWKVGCGCCSARQLVAKAGAEEIVCGLVADLYMGSL